MVTIHHSVAEEVTGAMNYRFDGVSSSLFNCIRHSVFKDVPVLAFDTITFTQYDGPLEPEMISHRFGQLPIGGSGDAATFSVHVVAPTDKSGLTWVTSRDVVCTSGNAEIVHYRTPAEAELASDDTGFLLVPLHPGQRVVLTLQARRSTGREATRWVSAHCAVQVSPFQQLRIETTGAIRPRDALELGIRQTLNNLLDLLGVIHAQKT